MKKTTITFVVMLISLLNLIAQNNSGTIIYEQKINMHKTIDDENIRSMMPEFRTSIQELKFNQNASVFKNYEDPEEESVTEENNGGVMIMIKTPENSVYKNFAANKSVELRELAGKNFLIQDSIKNIQWRVNPAVTKNISGYECMQATGIQKSKIVKMNVTNAPTDIKAGKETPAPKEDQITAWFAPDISASTGPAMFGGLPGIILSIDINDGEMIYLAQKIELKPVAEKEIKEPTGGKKVNREEFNKIQNDFFKEMEKGGGGMRVIRN